MILPSIVSLIISIRTICSILDMRSNAVFALCHATNACLNFIAFKLGAPAVLRTLVIGPSTTIILPIAYSRGPLSKRVSRTAIISLCALIPEIIAMATFLLFRGSVYFSTIDESNYLDVLLAHSLTMVSHAFISEALITVFRRNDQEWDAPLGIPVLCLLAETYALGIGLTMYHHPHQEQASYLAVIPTFACYVLTIAYCLAVLHLAHLDVRTKLLEADQLTQMRHLRHLKAEIEASSSRSISVNRLRHDFANQISIVEELALEGSVQEADHYLVMLLEQARSLTKDSGR